VYGSDKLAAIALNSFKTFGVTLYHDMEETCCGDSSVIQRDVPNIVIMESPVYYHTDHDSPNIVPEAGLEAAGRAFAKIVDDVNKVERRDLLHQSPTGTTSGKQ
jgi:hypothetical protein